MLATILQISGAVLITLGVGFFLIPAGLIVGGLFALAFGVAIERRK